MGDTLKTVDDYTSKIWKIAELTRNKISRAELNKIVIPFLLLRRLECALEPTREAVLEKVRENGGKTESPDYEVAADHPFYNVTARRLKDIGTQNTYETLKDYIEGFSPNARVIFQSFDLLHTAELLQQGDLLYQVCQEFSSDTDFDLSPDIVPDRTMTDIYEHVIERYGEDVAEAAEDFMTPRDVVRLAVKLLFTGEEKALDADDGRILDLYDQTAGTAGFLCDGMDMVHELQSHAPHIAPTRIKPYGQELDPKIWAMGASAMLLRNMDRSSGDAMDTLTDLSKDFKHGNTLTADAFPGRTFDYCVSNPPFGKNFASDREKVVQESEMGFDGRFGAGVPSSSDGSMLFIQNMVSKMKPREEGGSRAVIVLSGSPLFNGDAGEAESNIRRWLLERDLVECIVKLSPNLFYRTPITTYLWVLSTRKEASRTGVIQLIDASGLREPTARTHGDKRFAVTESQADEIVRMYADGVQSPLSKVLPVEEFAYRQIETMAPLRMELQIKGAPEEGFYAGATMARLPQEDRETIASVLGSHEGERLPYSAAKTLGSELSRALPRRTYKKANPRPGERDTLTSKPTADALSKAVVQEYGVRGPGLPVALVDGEPVMDPEAADVDNIPWGISVEDYAQERIYPFVPEAEIDDSVRDQWDADPRSEKRLGQKGDLGRVGTCIRFNKYFYKRRELEDPAALLEEARECVTDCGTILEGLL